MRRPDLWMPSLGLHEFKHMIGLGAAKPATKFCRIKADKPRVEHRGLPMFDRLAINRIAKHFYKCSDRWILGDETFIPSFIAGADQHELKTATPNYATTNTREGRISFAPVGRVRFRTCRVPPVRIGRP